MKGYAILSGGGVKGAALAGCIAAATECGITFDGFGGTSAGSIVAFLAACGYTRHNELHLLTVEDMDFRSFLDDKGKKILAARRVFDLVERRWWLINPFQFLNHLPTILSLHAKFSRDLGLYDGLALELFLFKKARERLSKLPDKQDFTFLDFANSGATPLRVVATDLRHQRAKIFSVEKTPDFPVLHAVRASAGYPFLFKPKESREECLVDGGIASNLPVFLFNKEHIKTRYPIFAFNLVPQISSVDGDYNLKRLCRDMIATSIDAGDVLLQENIPGVETINVEISADSGTLKFEMKQFERDALYLKGKTAATTFFGSYPPLKHATQAGDDLQKTLQSYYGQQSFYQIILAAIAQGVEAVSKAKNLRVSLMFPTGRTNGNRIVVYSYNFVDADGNSGNDSDLEISEFGGCSGQALRNKQGIAMDDLVEARKAPEARNLTADQMNKMPLDRRSILSVAIPGWSDLKESSDAQPKDMPWIAVLSLDSTTPLNETGWRDTGTKQIGLTVLTLLKNWACILGRMIP